MHLSIWGVWQRGFTGINLLARWLACGVWLLTPGFSVALELSSGTYAGVWRSGGGFFRTELVEDAPSSFRGSMTFSRRSGPIDIASEVTFTQSTDGTWSMEWTASPQGRGRIDRLQSVETPFGEALVGHFLGEGAYRESWSAVVIWPEQQIEAILDGLRSTPNIEIGTEREAEVDYWTSEDELAGNHVRCFHQTADGFLWIGTTSGLSRFDGHRFKTYSIESTPRLPDNNITGILDDPEGRLLISTKSSGIFRFDGRLFEPSPVNERLVGRWIKNLQWGHDGVLWFTTDQKYLCRLTEWDDLKEWPVSQFESGWGRHRGQNTSLIGIQEWAPGKMFLWRTRGWMIADLTGGSTVHFVLPNRLDDHFDGSTAGGAWLRWRKTLMRYDTDFNVLDTIPIAVEDGEPMLVRETRSGGLWIATKTKLIRYHSNRESEAYPLPQDLGLPVVMKEDREGNLWMSDGEHGICRYRFPVIRPQSFPGNGISAPNNVVESNGGEIYVASDDGITMLSAMVRHSLPTFDWLDHEGLALDPESADLFWCGLSVPSNLRQWNEPLEEGQFFPILARGRWGAPDLEGITSPLFPEGVDHIHSIVASDSQNVWLASRAGLLHYRSGQVRNWNLDNGLDEFDIFALHLGKSSGHLWVGTSEHGVLELEEGVLKQRLRVGDGLASDSALSFWEEEDGTLWIGGMRGLSRVSEGQAVQSTNAGGALDHAIQSIVQDRDGRFWLGTPKGLFVVPGDPFKVATGETDVQEQVIRLGSWDGLLGDGIREEFHPVSLRGEDGELFFCFPDGVQRINPNDVDSARAGPETVFVGAYGAKSTFLDQVMMARGEKAILPPEAGDLIRVEYTSPHFASSERVHFQYRMKNLSEQWASAGNQRMVWFSRLAPGGYRLEIRASDRNLRMGRPAIFEFEVLPRFYQTGWFRAGGLVMALGIIVLIHRERLRFAEQANRIREQERLNSERARIARDMHDEIGSSLAQIRLLGELAAKLNDDRSRDARQLPQKIADVAHESSRSLREIIWSLNPVKESIGDLGEFVEMIVDTFFSGTSIKASVVIHSENVLDHSLSPQFKREFVLMLKGILSNVVRHSQCREVQVSLSTHDGHLELICRDDGVGFDHGAIASGAHGIESIHQRAEILRGRVVFDSVHGRGTKVCVSLPLA